MKTRRNENPYNSKGLQEDIPLPPDCSSGLLQKDYGKRIAW